MTISATDQVTLAGADLMKPSLIRSSTEGDGNAGRIDIRTGQLTLRGASQIVSNGAAGSGDAGQVALVADTLTVMDEGRIASTNRGEGNAGTIDVQVGQLVLMGGGQLSTSILDEDSSGRGGTVQVRATERVLIDGQGRSDRRTAVSSQNGGRGEPGMIQVIAPTIELVQGGKITTETTRAGAGGDIVLEARVLTLEAGAHISAESTGLGNAGNIRLVATDTFLSQNSVVTTEAMQSDGGNITLRAQHMVRLRDSALTTAVGGGAETVGGNITIDPEFIILERSQIRAEAFAGRGGSIQITAGTFLADPTSQVSASSTLGIDGMVNIRAPVTDLSGTVAPLPQAFVQAEALLRQQCAEQLRRGQTSSFVLAGRDGLPLEPGGVLPSPLYQADYTVAKATRAEGVSSHVAISQGGLLGADATGRPQVQGWQAQRFSQTRLDLACSRWLGKQDIPLQKLPQPRQGGAVKKPATGTD